MGVDEAHVTTSISRNALKGFLTKLSGAVPKAARVNLVFLTTSAESREFFEDSAFARRWSDLYVREFSHEETIALIKKTKEQLWKRHHQVSGVTLNGISNEAFAVALRYANIEQPHAGNPTALKELLEQAIVRKLNSLAAQNSGKKNLKFILSALDVISYLKERKGLSLIAGDPAFETEFQKKWNQFRSEYGGNDGAVMEIEKMLRGHFGNILRDKMTTAILFGPPGVGKTYLPKVLAKTFFGSEGALLLLKGGELAAAHHTSRLIGSPPGYVGHENQRSELTRFVVENPQGGIIAVDEMDYAHHEVVRLLTSIITEMNFTDGMGKTYDLKNYIFMGTSNIGQEYMSNPDSKVPMTWEQYRIRRQNLTEKQNFKGKFWDVVKKEKMKAIFDAFVHTIVTKSAPTADTEAVAQEANKQKRRYTHQLYILPPDEAELLSSFKSKWQKYAAAAQAEYGVEFIIDEKSLEKILDVSQYDFEKGYTFVDEQLEDRLTQFLQSYFSAKGKKVNITLVELEIEGYYGQKVAGHAFDIQVSGSVSEKERIILGAREKIKHNPWGDSPEMRERIKNFTRNMEPFYKGNFHITSKVAEMLKAKAFDFNRRVVLSLVGPTGNGKTHFGYAMAMALFGDADALFVMSGLSDKFKLGEYIRPPAGTVDSYKETEFEKWVKRRIHAGGGVLVLDELLSFMGLHTHELGSRTEVFNELYELLDKGRLRIGRTVYDLSGFSIEITGNALQELFQHLGDDPDSERVARLIAEDIPKQELIDYFMERGIDPPKLARLGEIFVVPPPTSEQAEDIGKMKIAEAIQAAEVAAHHAVEVKIDERAATLIIEKLTNKAIGMRDIDNDGFKFLITDPLNGILFDFFTAKKVELKIDKQNNFNWFVDAKEVINEGRKIGTRGNEELQWVYKSEASKAASNRTPQITDIKAVKKKILSPETFAATLIHEFDGHWTVAYLLEGFNYAASISLVPNSNSLGRVRRSQKDEITAHSLSSVLKEMLMLNAGHRAEFLAGYYTVGASNEGRRRDPKESPSDDLGRAYRLYDLAVNNRFFAQLAEHSPAYEKNIARSFIFDLLDRTSDSLIEKAKASREFEKGRIKLREAKFLAEDTLKEIAAAIDYRKFAASPEELLLSEVAAAVTSIIEERREKLGSKILDAGDGKTAKQLRDIEFLQEFSNDLLARTSRELQILHPENKRIVEFAKALKTATPKGASGCLAELQRP